MKPKWITLREMEGSNTLFQVRIEKILYVQWMAADVMNPARAYLIMENHIPGCPAISDPESLSRLHELIEQDT